MPKEYHNSLGFNLKQLTLIRDFCARVYKNRVITGPYIFCNSNIEVELIDDLKDPLKHWEEHKDEPGVSFCQALRGDWSYICFKKGAGMLEYTNTPLPSYPARCKIGNIYFEEEGALPRDPYPHGWEKREWMVYNAMIDVRKKTYRELEKELGISMFVVRECYLKILEQCKSLVCFFPIGFEGYQYVLLTFKTKYEVGLEKALSKLDRTTYLYKYGELIILQMQVDPNGQEYNKVTARFARLEEMGIIHDLHVSIPIRWKNIHV